MLGEYQVSVVCLNCYRFDIAKINTDEPFLLRQYVSPLVMHSMKPITELDQACTTKLFRSD